MTEEVKSEFPFTPEQLRWIEALESGDYVQCKETLAKYNLENKRIAHCCLGVAVELFDPKNNYLRFHNSSFFQGLLLCKMFNYNRSMNLKIIKPFSRA